MISQTTGVFNHNCIMFHKIIFIFVIMLFSLYNINHMSLNLSLALYKTGITCFCRITAVTSNTASYCLSERLRWRLCCVQTHKLDLLAQRNHRSMKDLSLVTLRYSTELLFFEPMENKLACNIQFAPSSQTLSSPFHSLYREDVQLSCC